jgi:FkbM family methyltransferase
MLRNVKTRLGDQLIGVARGYIRFAPTDLGKQWLWRRFAWRKHDFVARTSFGALMAGNTEDIIQRYVYYFGVWEPNLSHFIARTLRPGDTFIDVGANIGYFSVLAAHLVGARGRSIAIEASPAIFRELERNIALNPQLMVQAHNVAATSAPGTVCLYESPMKNRGETSLVGEAVQGGVPVDVPGVRLDDLIGEELRRARLIKVDVEGAEWMVVAGMEKAIPALREDVVIVIEVSPHKLSLQGKSPADVLGPFLDAGFSASSLVNDYHPAAYLAMAAPAEPAPITGELTTETDVVLTRRAAASLR